jgi:predicted DCC family thiol-disulfide oxidoreductase YuxK
MARWARRRDRAGRVLAIPNQKRGALARHGVTREEADRAAWLIDGDGRRWEGADAVNRVLREMGGGWRTLASVYRFRPAELVEDLVYRWFAGNRSRFQRFGVRPECDEPGSDCE